MAIRARHGDEDRRTDRTGGRTAAPLDAQLRARRLTVVPVGAVAAGARDLPRRRRHFLPRNPAEQADRDRRDDRRRTRAPARRRRRTDERSEEHTSELQSLMRISYAVFCLEKKKHKKKTRSK